MRSKRLYVILGVMIGIFLISVGILNWIGNKQITEDGKPRERSFSLIPSFLFPSKKEPINVLLLVPDKDETRTDTIVLINYNPATAKMNTLSIPRDTKVKIDDSHNSKINAAYGKGGAELSVKVVENLLGVKIDYYVYFNISAFKTIVDILGGVDFDVPTDLKYDDPTQDLHIDLKKGFQHLDGDKAEQLLRFRKPQHGKYTKELLKYYDGGDLGRINTQQKFIKALIEQKVNIKYITKTNQILKEVFKNVKTDLSISEAIKLAANIGKIKSDELNTFRIDGVGTNSGAYYFLYNDKIVNLNTGKKESAESILEQFFITKRGLTKLSNEQETTNSTKKTNTPKPASGGKKKPKSTPTLKPTPKHHVTPSPTPVKDLAHENPSNGETSFGEEIIPEP